LRVRALIILSAILVCAYAIGVLIYVMTLPDIGVRSAFAPIVNGFDRDFLYPENQSPLKPGDRILAVGDKEIEDWPQLLRLLVAMRRRTVPPVAASALNLQDETRTRLLYLDEEIIRVKYERQGEIGFVWCRLGRSPLDTLLPTVLWFFIKAGLFVVGALVLWKRPDEPYARMFFLLSVVSCGAYIGGYHWQGIVTQPTLLLVFMVSCFLLPSVSLHFYLVFPRAKPFFTKQPGLTLIGLYGPPLFFLGLLLADYVHVRSILAGHPESTPVRSSLEKMLTEIYLYFGVALVLYLLSVWCLVHSYRTARNLTERNQVKWILYGAVLALAPLGYSLGLAVLAPDQFGRGGATWPMFCASLCVTVAFTISITRYRLMELDKLVSSGVVYFSISMLAALVYYGLVIFGVLVLPSQLAARPSLFHALGVAGTVLLLVVLLDLARSKLKKALDRHFRREKIQLDRTLLRMRQAIGQLVDPPTLAHQLLTTTTELLSVERGSVYLRQGDPPLYRLSDSMGQPPPLTELSSGCPLVEELQRHGRLCLEKGRMGANGTDPSPARRQLHFLGGDVAFALTHEGQMLALLLLGPRGDAYTSEDLNLLSAFAQVTVLALVSGEGGRTIEALNRDLQEKVQKIAEQQRRILALQSQLVRKQEVARPPEEMEAEQSTAPDPSESSTESPARSAPAGIIGSSPAVLQLLHLVRKVAGSTSAVLLRGESGTGKELLARAVHDSSPRAGRPFVKVHCAALAPTLLESELFGHIRGAFTGAVKDRTGRFETANGGTLFLDEIGDVSWEVQTKLLRVLQEMTFERVGSSESIQVDVRIIAATHQNLERLIQQGRFREDLFYRLNVLPLIVPPLRERREDIPELVQHFLRIYAAQSGKTELQLDDEALVLLKSATWPGNIRQLENVIERAMVITEGSVVTADHLPPDLLNGSPQEPLAGGFDEELPRGLEGERADRERREREQLVRALAATNGNKAEAARALGLKRSTLLSRLKKYGLS
jgi:transcriptional regulator with GAF, ATPase, and Fis domain